METNAYTSAMERLVVTPEMGARVLDGAFARTGGGNRRKPQFALPAALAACLILAVLASVFPGLLNRTAQPGILAPNPMHTVESVAELKESAPFPLSAPAAMPEGYTVEGTALIAGSLAQIAYTGPQGGITYRMAAGGDDISGDYNVYPETATERVGEWDVTLRGADGAVSLTAWTDGAYTYVLSFETPAAPETATSIIGSITQIE